MVKRGKKIVILRAVSLLIAFSTEVASSTPKGKPKKDKSRAKQKNKKSNRSKKNSPATFQKPEYMYEVGSPIGVCHIEYEILPGRPKYQIDVVCWKTIAKIYTLDGHIALKTCVKDDLSWVPIHVTHTFNELDVSDIFKLHGHVINYTITTNQKKLGNDAKKEKNKIFFINQKNLESPKKFSLAYDYDPNLNQYKIDEDRLENFIEDLIWECADYLGDLDDKEVITKLKFLDYPLHEYYTNKIIDRTKVFDTVMFKSFAPSCPPPSLHKEMEEDESTQKTDQQSSKRNKKQSKGNAQKTNKHGTKKDKSKKARKDKGSNVMTIKVSGECLYTDPGLAIHSLTVACGPLREAYVLMSTNELLTKKQKNEFNSLIIKINKITNLPVQELLLQGFKDISVRYNVPLIAQCTTVAKPLENCITFNEGHAHFLPDVPKLKFLEFIQTGKLIAEIRGRREQHSKTVEPSLFGFQANDKYIGRQVAIRNCKQILERWNVESTMVTLAVACFNVSSLLKPFWFVEDAGNCHHPDALLYKRNNYKRLDNRTTTINNINLEVLKKPNSGSSLTEDVLSKIGTSIDIEIHLSAPSNAFLELYSSNSIFNELFVIVKRYELAHQLLHLVMLHNQEILGPGVMIPSYLKSNVKKEFDPDIYNNVVTGFILNNGDCYIFFIEGLANGLVSHIWSQIKDFSRLDAHILYNSDFCFDHRLYPEFIPYGGVYVVNLKIDLHNILNQEKVYLEGNIPLPCWEALKKLGTLMKCNTLRLMAQCNLFPTVKEILSLDMEFGVPYQWYQTENLTNLRRTTIGLKNA